MTIVNTGFGLLSHKTDHYIDGQHVSSVRLNVDIHQIIHGLTTELNALPGQILTVDSNGNLEFKKIPNPIVDDERLRTEYPSLQLAWEKLLESLSEYEMVKKLVKEHNND